MSRRLSGGIPAAVTLVIVLAWPPPSTIADGNAAKTKAKPAEEGKADIKDGFEVPDGTIEELQKYIEGLNRIQPSSSLRPSVAELHKKRAAAELKACEKILAAKPTPEQAQAAIRAKLAALLLLGRHGDATAQDKLEATVDQAEKLGLKDTVREAQLAALKNLGEHASTMDEKEYGKLVERLKAYLKEGPGDIASARFAVSVALAAERSNRPALAVRVYRELGTLLADTKDEKFSAAAATMLGAARRLDLVGMPFLLEGSTVAGKRFDWRKYRGKVVLIDFFATWCGPCREEIPNITRCYKSYRKRGFDVIGISIDRNRKEIEDYLEKEKHPWTILLDRNEVHGTDKSMATYYGIFVIPQMILVGKDGKVLALNVRGEQLGRKLEELLGPADDGASKR